MARRQRTGQMEKPSKEWDTVPPCGMYCGECRSYIDDKCGGCRSGRGVAAEFSKECTISSCALKKGVRLCLDCGDFPCNHMDYFKARNLRESAWYIDIVNNMKAVREAGLERFRKRKDSLVKERLACAKQKGVEFCDSCKDWPCELCKNVPLINEAQVPP